MEENMTDDPRVQLLTNVTYQLDQQAELLGKIAYALSIVEQPAIKQDVMRVMTLIDEQSRRIFRYMEKTYLDIQDSS